MRQIRCIQALPVQVPFSINGTAALKRRGRQLRRPCGQRFDFFFAFLAFFAFFFGIIFLTVFLAFLATDFAASTTRLVTDFFFDFLAM
jgi:hypothetical protein